VGLGRVIDRRRAGGGGDEAQAVEDRTVHGRVEDLAQVAVSDGEPDAAARAGGGAEGLLAAGAPARFGSRAAGCAHLDVSQLRGTTWLVGSVGSKQCANRRLPPSSAGGETVATRAGPAPRPPPRPGSAR